MKFRGLMSDVGAMRDFMYISNGISKLSKECIMRITERKVFFIMSSDDAGPKKPYVWCELPVPFYFKEYTFVGANEQNNEIYLSFNTAMLSKSLTTLKQNAKCLKIKLSHKITPCITLEIDQRTEQSIRGRECVHDIPIEIIHRRHWGDYAEPTFNDFHVSIQMPSLKSIKHIVERMKNISPNLIVSANKYGRLVLRAKTNMVTISAHFPDLSVQSFAVGQGQTLLCDTGYDNEEENAETVTTVIDAKKFLMFLTGMQLNNTGTVCSIVHGQMLKLELGQPGAISLQCFLTESSG